MQGNEKYAKELNDYLNHLVMNKEPMGLYEPIEYIISLGGKRIRPILTLLTCDIYKEDFKKALPAAMALELFHNFSLIHDDIMDEAPLRRGKETVHQKWDLNTGILSGDAMLILAYRLFENYDPKMFQELAKLFSSTALQVCEGQQYDVDFETRNNVSEAEYIKMIEYKTAVLVGASMKMGAIVAQASESCKKNIYDFGRNLGIAFQLQDDYLDAFGDPEKFGKQIGGDIIANKKTYLYINALTNSEEKDRVFLEKIFSEKPEDPSQKIDMVKDIYQNSGASANTLNQIENYTQKAYSLLDGLLISEESKQVLHQFGASLMKRKV